MILNEIPVLGITGKSFWKQNFEVITARRCTVIYRRELPKICLAPTELVSNALKGELLAA